MLQFIAFLIAFQVLVSYFHETFWIPSIPGADPFFLIFSMCRSFPISTAISSTCVTLSFILLATVWILFLFGVFLSSSHILPQKVTNQSMLGTVPSYSFLSAVFLKKLPSFSSNIDCYIFMHLWSVFWSILSSTFTDSLPVSLWHLPSSLKIWVDSQLLFLTVLVFFFSSRVAFLRIFLRYISFAICAAIILLSFSCFCIF